MREVTVRRRDNATIAIPTAKSAISEEHEPRDLGSGER